MEIYMTCSFDLNNSHIVENDFTAQGNLEI